MKNTLRLVSALTAMFIITILTGICVIGQITPENNNKSIPAEVIKVFQKSCSKCHMEPGSTMALGGVNFTNWDKYTPEKQASKAKAVCNEISSKGMPPKRFAENNPAMLPTEDEIKTVCNWSASLPPVKK